MENKLTLKYLAPYLPYKLRIKVNHSAYEGIYILDLVDSLGFHIEETSFFWKRCIPILRPLSDLTKFCEDLGFVSIEELAKMSCSFDFDDLNVRNDWNGRYGIFSVQFRRASHFYEFKYDSKKQSFKAFTDTNHLQLFQQLLKWHFDIHGLIEKGLAVDINKLKE